MKKSIERKLNKLEAMFPNAWFKPGEYFSSGFENAIWTGEGSDINGVCMFNYYGYQNEDMIGVHPKMAATLKKMNMYADWYDAGTVFIWPNE
jgi:hypothetical protein